MPTPDRKSPFVEKRGDRWRVRWSEPDGKLLSATRDDDGRPFEDKAAAKSYGWEQARKVERGEWRDPAGGDLTVTAWVRDWWARTDIEDLTWSTKTTYQWAIDVVILPQWGHRTLASLTHCEGELADWKRKLRTEYAEKSINLAYGLFATVLADAHAADLITRDPTLQARSHRRRGRRVRAGGGGKAAEKPWPTPLQALLIAERAAALTGRDDDFTLLITTAYTGMRWSELVGLERRYVRGGTLRVEWQMQRQDGRWVRVPPKDESRRTIDIPPFLAALLAAQVTRGSGRCTCADHADTSYVWLAESGGHAYRATFDRYVFRPAAHGRRASAAHPGGRPVGIRVGAWPGVPLDGRAPDGEASASWTPILPGATPHSFRHGHKTWMIDARVEEVLQHERLGHELGGIGGVYSHVSPDMRARLMRTLTDMWEQSLAERAAMCPRSSVPVLDGLLGLHEQRTGGLCSRGAPKVAGSGASDHQPNDG